MISFRDKLYQFLSEHFSQYNQSPSFSEITQGMAISPRSKSLITRNLRMLEKENKVILKKDGRRLAIALATQALPLLGKISAGVPIEAMPDSQYIDLDQILQGRHRFALRVKGTSMIEEGILDGDIIICRETAVANEGDIVVALIDQHNTTLKRISYRVKGMVTLIPANPELKPRAYAPERIRIQGVYIGLVRMPRSG